MDKLKTEILQTKPFSSRHQEAYLNVLRTADFLAYDVADLLRQSDLSLSGYNVLRVLRGAGSPGLSSGEIGSRMLTRMPDMTRVLDRLEKAKLVERFRPEGDRRVVRARITGQGIGLLGQLDGPVEQLHERQLGHLTRSELETLIRLLERVREAAGGDRG